MTPSVVNKTLAVLGHARQADAFQSGREAAQMAKGQIVADFRSNLVLVFGPDNVHFKDLIEGVRLVTGEDILVGVPTRRVIANEVSSSDASVVLLLQSPEHHITMASTPYSPNTKIAAVSSLFTQLRDKRGNVRKQFAEHGLLVFDNTASTVETARTIGAEAGLDTWEVCVHPLIDQKTALVCGDKALPEGIVLIECLSQAPWGLGQVSIGQFKNMTGIYQHAIRSALRAALTNMGDNKPAFGLVMFHFSIDDISATDLKNFFMAASSVVGEIPLVGFSTTEQHLRDADQSLTLDGEWMTVLLAPQ